MEQSVSESLCQCGTSGEYNVAVESFSQVHVCPMYRFHDNLVHTRVLEADDFGIKQDFRCTKPFCADLELVSARQKV